MGENPMVWFVDTVKPKSKTKATTVDQMKAGKKQNNNGLNRAEIRRYYRAK